MLSVLFLDQVSKYLAKYFLQPVHSVPVLGDFFRLTYVENPGIAFGLRIENKLIFTLLSILAIIIIFYYLFAMKDHKVLRIAFAFILGGALGNLIDRFLYGRVVDFLDFQFFDIRIPQFKILFFDFSGYSMDRWPVFNVADIAVTVGMIIILINALFDKQHNTAPSNDTVENS
ncbi:MAG: signal peptidase II [Calditrichaeota bacterium]|nr:signal peptidase II [Calditrichota bacterium]RQW00005.1 MAG: signal peptidase II [Calditrichota bacterium]